MLIEDIELLALHVDEGGDERCRVSRISKVDTERRFDVGYLRDVLMVKCFHPPVIEDDAFRDAPVSFTLDAIAARAVLLHLAEQL